MTLWYEHMGFSITGAAPADVGDALKYGRWIRTGYEDGWDQAALKRFVAEAHIQGAKVLACIQPSKQPRYVGWTFADLGKFSDYAASVASLGVDGIELGNELNNPMFNGLQPNDVPMSVAAMLGLVVGARLRKDYPTLQVISNGVSPSGDHPELAPQTAVVSMLATTQGYGGANNHTGYGYHPYEMTSQPTESTTVVQWNPCWWMRRLWSNLSVAQRKSLWLTEYGYKGTDQDQAIWAQAYMDAFAAHRQAGVALGNLFWHTLHEGSSALDPSENTMGILRNGIMKPAAWVLAAQSKLTW